MKEKRELTKMRDAELLRDYRAKLEETMRSGKPINRREIVREVLESGRPRYYLKFEQAYNVVTRMHSRGVTGRRLTLKQQMWQEIYDKMQQEMAANAGMVMHEALARVLYSGRASRYFISPGYAYRYIYGVQREAYKKFVAKRA